MSQQSISEESYILILFSDPSVLNKETQYPLELKLAYIICWINPLQAACFFFTVFHFLLHSSCDLGISTAGKYGCAVVLQTMEFEIKTFWGEILSYSFLLIVKLDPQWQCHSADMHSQTYIYRQISREREFMPVLLKRTHKGFFALQEFPQTSRRDIDESMLSTA